MPLKLKTSFARVAWLDSEQDHATLALAVVGVALFNGTTVNYPFTVSTASHYNFDCASRWFLALYITFVSLLVHMFLSTIICNVLTFVSSFNALNDLMGVENKPCISLFTYSVANLVSSSIGTLKGGLICAAYELLSNKMRNFDHKMAVEGKE